MKSNNFDAYRKLDDSLVAVRRGYLWGLIDKNSKLLMRVVFDYISTENGRIWARYQGQRFYLPKDLITGFSANDDVIRTPFSYDEMSHISRLHLIFGIRNIVFKEAGEISDNSYYKKRIVSSNPSNRVLLRALYVAATKWFSEVTLIGDKGIISEICLEERIDINCFHIIHMPSHSRAFSMAWSYYNDGKADSFTNGFRYDIWEKYVNGIIDIYNENGEILFQGVKYEEIDFKNSGWCNGYLRLKIRDDVYIYKDNKLIVKPGRYDEIGTFNPYVECNSYREKRMDAEFAFVRNDKKWGVINCDGELRVPVFYDKIEGVGSVEIKYNFNNLAKYAFLFAKNGDYADYYVADKSLKKLPYGWISRNNQNGNFIVANTSLPAELVLEQLSSYIDENDLESEVDFGLIDAMGHELIPCYYSIERIMELDESYKNSFSDIYDNTKCDCIISKHLATGKYGLVDRTRRPLCGFVFDSISEFNEDGMAKVRTKDGSGIISHTGEIILPCKYKLYVGNSANGAYESKLYFTEGYLAVSCDDKMGLIDKEGHFVVPCKYPWFDHFNSLTQQILLKKGYLIVVNNAKKGLVKISNPDDYLLKCDFNKIELYSYNTESVFNKAQTVEDKYVVAIGELQCMVIDLDTGKIVLDIESEKVLEVLYITEHYVVAHVEQNGHELYQVLSLNDNKIISEYLSIGFLWEDRFLTVCKNDKWGSFDVVNGAENIPCLYDEKFIIYESSDYIAVKKSGKYGYIDKENNLIIDFKYEDAKKYEEGYAAVKTDQQWGFVDSDGIVIAEGFDNAYWFSEGFAPVEKDEKWGYINTDGKLVIPYRFARAGFFHDGLADVAFKTKYGYIDIHNRTVIPFKYDYVGSFVEGIAFVEDESGKGHISKDDSIVDWEDNVRNYYDDKRDAAKETWWAMTEGMEGDYPGSMVDYDALGF